MQLGFVSAILHDFPLHDVFGFAAAEGVLERVVAFLADRFTDSSLVYQGIGRGLGADTVVALDRIACRGLKPDLTILVDVDAEASLARARARNLAEPHCETRLDDDSIEFHRKVFDAYHALAGREPDRVKLVNGRSGIDAIEEEVWAVVSGYLEDRHV